MLDTLLTDTELFAAVKLNDEKAFNTLFDRYWIIVYKKAFLYLHNPEVCAEIVNDVFIAIWHKRHVLQIITFKNYLAAAVRYRIYNHIRNVKHSPLTYLENYDSVDYVITADNQGEQHLSFTDMMNGLQLALNKLPVRCKEIFILSKIDQLSNTEIADKLAISKRSVENQLSSAIKYLRIRLKHFMTLLIILFCF
jgi:RNA polymerase sigma-70 factor (ECF subfamily)